MDNQTPTSTTQTLPPVTPIPSQPMPSAPPPTPPAPAQAPAKKPDYLLLAIIGAIIIFLVIIIAGVIIGVSMIHQAGRNITVPTAPETPSAPVVTPKAPSKFATDAGVLQIKNGLRILGSQTDSVDLIEPQISPPNLDLNISIPPNQ